MSEEKPERERREKEEPEKEEKWRQDPLSRLFAALILILLGVTFLFAAQGWMDWGDWWKYFILGLGVIFLIDAGLRYFLPAYRRPVSGRLITGLILICIGAASIGGWGNWWPLILIIIGIGFLLQAFLRRR